MFGLGAWGHRRFAYDDAHQLTGVVSSAGTHSFVYNDAGFLTREVTAAGVTREYTYDAVGQLVRLVDSEAGVSEFVYDGLGRRVQHRRADGSVRDFAFSPVGLLAQVADDGAPVVRLWNDALGQVAGVVGVDGSVACELVWDLAAGVPTVLGTGGAPVSLAVGVGVDVLGARGVDPFGVSPVVWGFGSGLAGGVSVAGSLQVAGLEVLGARAYDPVSRGFMSPDPVASPVGAGWGANVYCFVGNAPSVLVDPWGLSPMSAAQFKEYREDVSGRVVERLGKGLEDWANEHSTLIGIGMLVGGVAAIAFLGPLGAAVVGGALLSGGMSVFTSKNSDGTVNWGKVGLDTLIGGVAGGAGGLLVKGIGAVRGVAHLTKGVNAAREGLSKSMQGFSVLDDAVAAGTRSVQLAQKAASSARYNPMRYVNSWRSGQLGRQAESFAVQGNKLISQGDELLSVANTHLRKYEYFADFANQKAGKVLSGGLSGGIQNEYAYLSAEGDHSVLGGVSSFVGGTVTGALSPVIPKVNNPISNFVLDRGKDYASGVINYASRTAPSDWDWGQANDKGVSSLEKGTLKGIGKSGSKFLGAMK